MIKVLGGVLVGVFVGAFAVEVMRRTRPELLNNIEARARDAVEAFATMMRRPSPRERWSEPLDG